MSDQTTPAKPKLCIDCKHFIPATYPRFLWIKPAPMSPKYAQCAHPSTLDLVSGEASRYCKVLRDSEVCGPEAKLFEPKD